MNVTARVVLATDTTVRGGVDRYVIDLAAVAMTSGVDTAVVLERCSDVALGEQLAQRDVAVHRRHLHHRSHDPELINHDCRDVLTMLAPDIVHVVCGSPRSCLTLRETATSMGIPTVITEQYVPDGLVLPPNTWSRIESSYKTARAVIFVSEGNRAEMARTVRLDLAETYVIPNAVPVRTVARRAPAPRERRRRAAARRSAGRLRVMSAARLAPQKGIDVLIEAMSRLGGSSGMRLDLFGDGPERARLRTKCIELGVADTVCFRGWSNDVIGELGEHDLLVLASRNEGMPYVVLEAMASGIPIIATDVPGTVEALDGGRLGTVVARDAPAELTRALAHWHEHLDDALKLAQQAAVRVSERHDLEARMAQTLALWPLATRAG